MATPRRIGKPLPPASEGDAAITPSDIARAGDQWQADAPSGWKNLLDAGDAEPDIITTTTT